MAKDNHDDLLLYGALAIGVFIVGKSILNAIGINPADTQAVSDQQSLPPSDNPLSPAFQPEVDSYNNNPSRDANGDPVDRNENYINVRALFFDPESVVNTDPTFEREKRIAAAGEVINEEISGFHLTTDPAPIMAAFATLRTQSEVSELAEYMFANFGVDLMTYLKGSLFKAGLSDTDFATLIRQINNLPQ